VGTAGTVEEALAAGAADHSETQRKNRVGDRGKQITQKNN